MTDIQEIVIQRLREEKTWTLSSTESAFTRKMKSLAAKHPDDVKLVENKDGSIYMKVPLKWVKISPPRVMSEEERKKLAARGSQFRFTGLNPAKKDAGRDLDEK